MSIRDSFLASIHIFPVQEPIFKTDRRTILWLDMWNKTPYVFVTY